MVLNVTHVTIAGSSVLIICFTFFSFREAVTFFWIIFHDTRKTKTCTFVVLCTVHYWSTFSRLLYNHMYNTTTSQSRCEHCNCELGCKCFLYVAMKVLAPVQMFSVKGNESGVSARQRIKQKCMEIREWKWREELKKWN